MSINITPEIKAAFAAYLDEAIDADASGKPIRRRDTSYAHYHSIVDFAAGFQAGSAPAAGVRENSNG